MLIKPPSAYLQVIWSPRHCHLNCIWSSYVTWSPPLFKGPFLLATLRWLEGQLWIPGR